MLRVLRYPNTVKDRKLIFRGRLRQTGGVSGGTQISGYSNSDWTMGSTGCQSCSGIVCYLIGDLVAWFTHKQLVVATSSTMDEYVDVLDICKDVQHINVFILYIHHYIHPYRWLGPLPFPWAIRAGSPTHAHAHGQPGRNNHGQQSGYKLEIQAH